MQELPELLLSYGIHLKKQGEEYLAKCIAHDDTNPSMSVYRNGGGKWVAHCFSCNFHGDVVRSYCELNGLDMDNKSDVAKAYKALEDDVIIHTGKPYATITDAPTPKKPERTMLIPAADTPPPKMNWLQGKDGEQWGEPDEVFIFRQPDSTPLMYEARWNITDKKTGEIKKECRCFSWGKRGNSAPAKWECSHHMPPRPLYGLDMLAKMPNKQVVVTEGPRKAFYAQQLLTSLPCIGWAGGAQGWSRTDWSPIAGRNVILWPDADKPGRECMDALAQHLIGLECTVHILDTTDMPDAWDAADAVKEGWDTARTLEWAKANKGEKIEKKTPEELDVARSEDQPELPPPADDYLPELKPIVIQSEGAFTENGITWTIPSDVFQEIQAPQINPDCLPACIRDWMIDTAGVKGVDPSMLALSAIVASAGCLHDEIKIQPERTNPGWQESARLWGAIVGSSGIKKSPAIGAAVSRLKKIQLELSAQAAHKLDDVKAQEMAFDLEQKEYIKKLSKKEFATKPQRPELPEITRLFFEDVTVEKLGEELKTSPRGAFVLRDELAGWFGSHSKYRSTGTDAPEWLDFYEGGAKYIDRIGRGSLFVPNWGGSILGGIQPSALQRILENLPEDGLLQRFMVINARQGCEGNEQPYNKNANDRYHAMLQRLFDTAPTQEIVHLSLEANEIRKQLTRHSNKLVRAQLVSTGLCSHLAKWEGLVARLMLTFHAIECADQRIHPQSCPVQESTALQVQSFMMNFLLPHTIAFYINIAGQSNIGHAIKKIAELCLLRENGEISTRDIAQGWIGWRHYKPFDQETALNALVEHGWIHPSPKARTSLKGFPTRFLLNPRLHEYHAVRIEEERERRSVAVEAIKMAKDDRRAGV